MAPVFVFAPKTTTLFGIMSFSMSGDWKILCLHYRSGGGLAKVKDFSTFDDFFFFFLFVNDTSKSSFFSK